MKFYMNLCELQSAHIITSIILKLIEIEEEEKGIFKLHESDNRRYITYTDNIQNINKV